MSLLLLTSYERMLRYLGSVNGDALTSAISARRDIERWIPTVSQQIENYLNTGLYLESRTEYFDALYNQKEFFVKGSPATILTSVKEDSSGLFEGAESTLTDCYIGVNGRSVCLPRAMSYTHPHSIQIVYTGGLATSAYRTVFSVTPEAGKTWVLNKYVSGNTSGACGIVRAIGTSQLSLTIELLYGTFEVAETITMQDSEGTTGSADATAVIVSRTTTALCETAPDIVLAAEIQIRYNYTYRLGFENASVSKDSQTIKRAESASGLMILQPEAQVLLDAYVRQAI